MISYSVSFKFYEHEYKISSPIRTFIDYLGNCTLKGQFIAGLIFHKWAFASQ